MLAKHLIYYSYVGKHLICLLDVREAFDMLCLCYFYWVEQITFVFVSLILGKHLIHIFDIIHVEIG